MKCRLLKRYDFDFISLCLYMKKLLYYILLVISIFIFFISYYNCLYENLDNKNTIPTKFLQDNDVQYHETAEIIQSKNPLGTWMINKGNVEYVPWVTVPTTFTFSSEKKNIYVPSYIDSILYSKKQKTKIINNLENDNILFSNPILNEKFTSYQN